MPAGRWIKLYEVFLTNKNFRNETERGLAVRLLLMAAYKQTVTEAGKNRVVLEPGEMVLSIREIAKSAGMPRNTLARTLDRFEEFGFIQIKQRRPAFVCRIRNWSRYQGEYDAPDLEVVGGTESVKKPAANKDKTQGEVARELVDIYNEVCGEAIGRVIKITDARRKTLLKRFADEFGNSVDEWRAYCERVASNKFLAGKVIDFKANFDWIINLSNCVKILEGKYQQHQNENARPMTAYERAILDWIKNDKEGPKPRPEDFRRDDDNRDGSEQRRAGE